MPLDSLIKAAESLKPRAETTAKGSTTAPAPTIWGDRIGAR